MEYVTGMGAAKVEGTLAAFLVRLAAHGDALGDPLPDGFFLVVGECWDTSGIPGVASSFYNSPADRQGMACSQEA